MKIVIVGNKQKKIVEFNDTLLAIKIVESGRQAYYRMVNAKLKKLYNKNAKRFVDALIARDENVKQQ